MTTRVKVSADTSRVIQSMPSEQISSRITSDCLLPGDGEGLLTVCRICDDGDLGIFAKAGEAFASDLMLIHAFHDQDPNWSGHEA
ncbi:MAG: hypothetical protein WCQ91_05920 [Planctomycetota bacterium]